MEKLLFPCVCIGGGRCFSILPHTYKCVLSKQFYHWQKKASTVQRTMHVKLVGSTLQRTVDLPKFFLGRNYFQKSKKNINNSILKSSDECEQS